MGIGGAGCAEYSCECGENPRPGARGAGAVKDLYNAGVFTKVTGDSVLISPPFVSEEKDIERMIGTIRNVVSAY